MSNDATTTPQTSRQYVEEAMRRLVDTRAQISGSTWQHIVRFFRGDAGRARVAYLCEPPRTEVAEEDGTPAVLSTAITVRVSSHMRDEENAEQDEVAARILGLMFDGPALRDALNEAMAEDYGDVFRVLYCEPTGDADTRVDGKRQITELKATIWLPACEGALAYAAQNQ